MACYRDGFIFLTVFSELSTNLLFHNAASVAGWVIIQYGAVSEITVDRVKGNTYRKPTPVLLFSIINLT
jgi:hypothetical protein